jgi:steroid 5-alpha reductase family enzyme
VGVAGVLAALVFFAAWAVRSHPQRASDKRERTVWAAAVAACSAFVVQSSMDLIWRFPALVAIAFLWLAIAIAPRGVERGEDQS